mmetsp:Transcript_29610/g.67901  ORF Transcript_29610/g.67901 Transcript_29610/m.67901 type:complete len:105 (+) Transcript_29610:33-347(+)
MGCLMSRPEVQPDQEQSTLEARDRALIERRIELEATLAKVKVHIGPLEVGTDGVVLKPQLMWMSKQAEYQRWRALATFAMVLRFRGSHWRPSSMRARAARLARC